MEQVIKKLPSFSWKRLWVTLLVIVGGSFLLTWKLGSLTSGFAPQELLFIEQSSSFHSIIENPLNAPHKLLIFACLSLGLKSVLYLRLVSVLLGIIMLTMFFFWVKTWSTRRMATLSTILIICSSWFLSYARIATPHILQPLFLTLLFWIIVFQAKSKKNKTKLVITASIVGLALYTPGILWLLVPTLMWRWKKFYLKVKSWSLTTAIISATLSFLLITPLLYAFFNNPNLISDYLGFPTVAISPLDYFKNLAFIPINLFIYTDQPAYLWLNSTPLLDIFSIAVLIIGLYKMFYFALSRRSLIILSSLVVLPLAIALGGLVKIGVIMPLIYLLAAYGMVLMLQQWFTVFPKNPFARTLGASIITVSVIFACLYGVSKYFIAWPNSPNTKNAFTSRQTY